MRYVSKINRWFRTLWPSSFLVTLFAERAIFSAFIWNPFQRITRRIGSPWWGSKTLRLRALVYGSSSSKRQVGNLHKTYVISVSLNRYHFKITLLELILFRHSFCCIFFWTNTFLVLFGKFKIPIWNGMLMLVNAFKFCLMCTPYRC